MTKLTDHRLLSFDVYGTLIDWETGIITALQPLLQQLDPSRPSREEILSVYHSLEKDQQSHTPSMPYSELLTAIYPLFASHFNLTTPNEQECTKFGSSVGSWPAFPDTVDALRRLGRHYKLVVLSNVDRQSFALTNAGPLQNIEFDRVITAQDVGSYKPDPQNFAYMLDTVQKELSVGKGQVLQTAQSQFHDHHPAREAGIRSVWIERKGTMGNRDEEVYDWKFTTLGDMADAVEKELEVK